MPLLKITTTKPASPEHVTLLGVLSRLVAERIGKPETFVMTIIEHPAKMTFGGTSEPCCYAELKSIGRFRPEATARLSADLCEQLSGGLGVPKERIYIEFQDSDAYMWGHNGVTFA